MLIDIYESATAKLKFLSVLAGTDVSKLQLPEDVDKDYLKLAPKKSSVEIGPLISRIALDAVTVEADILSKGYALHSVSITSSIQTRPGGHV